MQVVVITRGKVVVAVLQHCESVNVETTVYLWARGQGMSNIPTYCEYSEAVEITEFTSIWRSIVPVVHLDNYQEEARESALLHAQKRSKMNFVTDSTKSNFD